MMADFFNYTTVFDVTGFLGEQNVFGLNFLLLQTKLNRNTNTGDDS